MFFLDLLRLLQNTLSQAEPALLTQPQLVQNVASHILTGTGKQEHITPT